MPTVAPLSPIELQALELKPYPHWATVAPFQEFIAEPETARMRYQKDSGIVIKSDKDDDEEKRELSPEMRELAAAVLDALQELPFVQWAMQKMQEEKPAGFGGAAMATGGEVSDASGAPVPKPQLTRHSRTAAATPAKPVAKPTPPKVDERPVPMTFRPTIDAGVRSNYSRLCADSQNKKLDYSRRRQAHDEALAIRQQHADSSATIAKAAQKRAVTMGISFDRALMELSGGHPTCLPEAPSWLSESDAA